MLCGLMNVSWCVLVCMSCCVVWIVFVVLLLMIMFVFGRFVLWLIIMIGIWCLRYCCVIDSGGDVDVIMRFVI